MHILLLILALYVNAADLEKFVAEPPAKAAARIAGCDKKIEKLVRETVRQMGYKKKFGLKLTRESAGQDSQNHPLVKYSSGVFIVDEGYLSNSGAEVTVRVQNGGCEPIRADVSTGG